MVSSSWKFQETVKSTYHLIVEEAVSVISKIPFHCTSYTDQLGCIELIFCSALCASSPHYPLTLQII